MIIKNSVVVLVTLSFAMVCFVSNSLGFSNVIYTSLKSSDCFTPSKIINDRYVDKELSVQECPAPKGWRLFSVASDERSWLDLMSDDKVYSTESIVVYNNQFGNFPNIGSEKAEWHISNDGTVRVLIFRISAQDPSLTASNSGVKNLSKLFVIKFLDQKASFCGVSTTNTGARDLAQKSKVCVELSGEKVR